MRARSRRKGAGARQVCISVRGPPPPSLAGRAEGAGEGGDWGAVYLVTALHTRKLADGWDYYLKLL
jgi:hypothetical protein